MPLQPRSNLLLWTVAALCVLAIGIQFIRPTLTNPPVTAEIQAPPEVKQVLRTSCYNCHSNETKLSWFDQIVPAYWMVVSDVKQARQHVNFSELGSLPIGQQKGILFEAVNQIQLGAMPLPPYRFIHPHATVTAEALAVLRNYLSPPTAPMSPGATDTRGPQPESANTTQEIKPPANVEPAPNGIAFLPDYKNWKTISSSDRFDNNTIREVLGNDVAIKAIAESHINPWPDGTAFAKVAWIAQVDDNGVAHAGKFYQVEFMIRDSQKYAATKNWGFARWRGTELKPYGKDASFTSECVGCHTPLRKNDYVYTIPLRGQQ